MEAPLCPRLDQGLSALLDDLQPVKDNGFRPSGPGPDEVVGEGRTDSEALLNLRKAIESRIRAGAKLTSFIFTFTHAMARRST